MTLTDDQHRHNDRVIAIDVVNFLDAHTAVYWINFLKDKNHSANQLIEQRHYLS